MTGALPSFSPKLSALTPDEMLKAAFLWREHRDTERISIALSRHESVIYNALDTIKDAARVAYGEAAE